MRRFVLAMLVGALVSGFAVTSRAEVTIYAAASLTDVLGALGKGFASGAGEPVRLVLGASSDMARQIVAGAPADLFISANKDWALEVGKAGFGAPVAAFGNRLVMISASDDTRTVALAQLPEALGAGRLALGDPDHVPAGQYAKAALTAAGLWPVLEARIAPAADVRAAVQFVASGAAPLGIVYATDARLPGVRIAGEIDPALYPPVAYYLALPAQPTQGARAFAAYLGTAEARLILSDYGFSPIETAQ